MTQTQTNELRNSQGYKIIYNLLKEYMDYPHSPEMETRIQQWLIDDEHRELKDLALDDLLMKMEFTPKTVDELDENQKKNLNMIKQKLNFEPNDQEDYLDVLMREKAVEAKRIPLRTYLLRAAAVLIPIMAVTGWYMNTQTQTDVEPIAQVQQTAQQQPIEVATANGQCTEQNLADGSHVVVNAGSKLTYSNTEQSKERKVTLVGEAYFSVAKVEEKSFVVQTKYLDVKVLGTQFDVKAYPEENKTVVTLNEGKVEVETKNKEIYNILPGQQLVYNNTTGEVKIKTVSADQSSAWKDGNLYLEDATINEIIRELERVDGVNIAFEKAMTNKEHYSLKFTNNENINQKMSVLKDLIGGFSYTIDGKNIKITSERTEVKTN